MTVPPDEDRSQAPPSEPAHAEQPLDFDPYRFGKPDHPVPPEFAPPGYVPPAPPPPAQHYPWPPEQPSGQPSGQRPPQQPYPAQQQYPPQYQYPPPYPAQPHYPQQPYQQQPYPPGAYGAPRQGTNTKAVLSLVFGVLAILLCWTTLWDALLIVPAIVLGALGRSDAQRFPERGRRGMATSGLICGIVAGVLAIVSTVYIYNRIKPCLDQFETRSSSFQQCASDHLLGRD